MSGFFLASDDDLRCLDETSFRAGGNGGMMGAEVDLLMLCNLEAILTGAEWESVFDRVYINPVHEQGPDGPWIYQVSACLLEALQKLTPERLADCVSQWAESDEWTLRDCGSEKIAEVLNGLIGLARLAGLEKKSVFISTEP